MRAYRAVDFNGAEQILRARRAVEGRDDGGLLRGVQAAVRFLAFVFPSFSFDLREGGCFGR